MKTAKDLARRKMSSGPAVDLSETAGPYSHKEQRRWVGMDSSLIEWSEKSDTSFDNESSDPD
jgi:hypothetical protein